MDGDLHALISNQAILVYSWSKVMLKVLKENLRDSVDYCEILPKKTPTDFVSHQKSSDCIFNALEVYKKTTRIFLTSASTTAEVSHERRINCGEIKFQKYHYYFQN